MTFVFISDETLLGYLLGALDDAEHLAVREALLKDRHLRVRLSSLQSIAISLHGENDLCEPPPSMVSKVMSDLNFNKEVDHETSIRLPRETPTSAENEKLILGSVESRSAGAKIAWLDTGMSLTAAAIGFCLLAPAILQTRESARASQCQGSLMALGQQIRDYAFQDRHTRVPEVPTEGSLAFAGIYAIHLNDKGYLEEKQLLWCPSEPTERLTIVGIGERLLPSAVELQSLPATRLRIWQHIAGGSYAYNLGVLVNNQHSMPTLDAPSNVAILADAPAHPNGETMVFTAHRGLASNVLYQDGHVQLIRFDHDYDGSDHPYLNRNGVTEAGVDHDDSALGVSYLSPLGRLR